MRLKNGIFMKVIDINSTGSHLIVLVELINFTRNDYNFKLDDLEIKDKDIKYKIDKQYSIENKLVPTVFANSSTSGYIAFKTNKKNKNKVRLNMIG